MITHRFHLRSSRVNAQGESSLYFIVNTPAQVWICTGVFISPGYWDQKKQMPGARCRDLKKISELKLKADLYLLEVNSGQLQFSREGFEAAVIMQDLASYSNPLISDLLKEYLDINDFSWGRCQQYETLKTDIATITAAPRLKHIDFLFAKKLQKKLQEKNNSPNTVARKLKMLKTIVHFAMNKKLIKEDPLRAIRIKTFPGQRFGLSPAELVMLQEKFDQRKFSDAQAAVMRNFLFCCYTGLRYSDLKALKLSDITCGVIIIRMQKTNEQVKIPLLPQAKALLYPNPDGSCMPVFTNQATNRLLKEIAEDTGLQKTMTFHCARHTFATVSLRLGMPMRIIQKLLGHKKLGTTEIYAAVLDDQLLEEMAKWNKLSVA